MLVLTRKLGQKIFIGDDITITVVHIDRGKIRLGIEAPRHIQIMRDDLIEEVNRRKGVANEQRAESSGDSVPPEGSSPEARPKDPT